MMEKQRRSLSATSQKRKCSAAKRKKKGNQDFHITEKVYCQS